MPAVHFSLTWPDGEQATYYSPSTVIHEHFSPGASYALEEFAPKIRAALMAASERVYRRYGYHCSAAADELNTINQKLQTLREQQICGAVTLTHFEP